MPNRIPPTMLKAALLGRYGWFVKEYEAPTRYRYRDERYDVEVTEEESRYQAEVAERIRAGVPPIRRLAAVLNLKGRTT